MNNLKTIGRIIFGLPFVVFGINHFLIGSNMAGLVPSFIPGGAFWVYLVGVGFLLAGISIIINKKVKLSGTLLGILLLIFVLTIHLPGVIKNPMGMSLIALLKDTALAGASFFLAAVLSEKE